MSSNLFSDLQLRTITAACLVFFFLFFYFFVPVLLSITFASILLIILCYEWPQLGPWWLAPLYPILPFICLILLNQSPERRLLIFLFALSALFDSAGYFFGKLYGKHPFAPSISPFKTWEGVIAGFITAFIVGPFLMQLLDMKALGWLTIPFLALYCLLALAGGLLVSKLKRNAGIKDSSALLPGHGGLLDRFDSGMLTGVFLYFLRNYLI